MTNREWKAMEVEPKHISSVDLLEAMERRDYATYHLLPMGKEGYVGGIAAEAIHCKKWGVAAISWGGPAEWVDGNTIEQAIRTWEKETHD